MEIKHPEELTKEAIKNWYNEFSSTLVRRDIDEIRQELLDSVSDDIKNLDEWTEVTFYTNGSSCYEVVDDNDSLVADEELNEFQKNILIDNAYQAKICGYPIPRDLNVQGMSEFKILIFSLKFRN